MERLRLVIGIALAVHFSSSILFGEELSSREKAKKLYKNLIGLNISDTDASFDLIERLLRNGSDVEAGRVVLANPDFYDLTLRSWAAPLTNRERLQDVSFDDMQAMIFGVVRDRLDARLLLTGNFLYRSNMKSIVPPTRANNEHYAALEASGANLVSTLVRVTPQWADIEEASGVLTTRSWGAAYYSAGTNRRALQHAFEIFMCRPLQTIRDASLPENFIRRDVDRVPGGNPRIFQQDCRGCHSGMDAMAGAFSRWDMVDGVLTYLGKDKVADKYNINSTTYPEGYITHDDSWVNLWSKNHNQSMGWRGPLKGRGLRAFATMLGNSEGFSRCMVERTLKSVCKGSPDGAFLADDLDHLQKTFEESQYDLSHLFISIGLHEKCE